MWLMLPTGALSIVQRKKVPENEAGWTLQVRARRREYLNDFRQRYYPKLGKTISTPHADYPFRAMARPEDLAEAVGKAVLAINYDNFKSATQSKEHGLKSVKLRDSLHSAYSRIWGDLLAVEPKRPAGIVGKYHAAPTLTGIKACQAWGHWWPKGRKTCTDCGEPNPSYPDAGPSGVYPEGYPKPASSKPVYPGGVSGVGSGKSSYTSFFEENGQVCKGSWDYPKPGTRTLSEEAGGPVSGECQVCGQMVELSMDGRKIRMHDKLVEGEVA